MSPHRDPTAEAGRSSEDDLADQRGRLKRHVTRLASAIGPRNIYHYEALQAAAAYVEASLAEAGHTPARQPYEACGKAFANIVAEVAGTDRRGEIVVVGAHYDSHKDSPGADDNASAVAALLELARRFAHHRPSRTLRFVAFANEEAPFTRRKAMGSRVYARECRRRGDNIVGMVCLESLGYYSEEVGSQWLSFWGLFLPRRGDFLALVANRPSRALLARVAGALERRGGLPYRRVVLPSHVPGAWSSDHWSFWLEGYPALMVTDTVPLRNPHYHKREDTPDKVDFARLGRGVDDLEAAVSELVGNEAPG
jgi:Zn-dependent M28 family amino/carboxypeptidase